MIHIQMIIILILYVIMFFAYDSLYKEFRYGYFFGSVPKIVVLPLFEIPVFILMGDVWNDLFAVYVITPYTQVAGILTFMFVAKTVIYKVVGREDD